MVWRTMVLLAHACRPDDGPGDGRVGASSSFGRTHPTTTNTKDVPVSGATRQGLEAEMAVLREELKRRARTLEAARSGL